MRHALLLLIGVITSVSLAQASSEAPGPEQTIESTSEELLELISTRDETERSGPESLEDDVNAVLWETVDFDAIVRGVLGRHRGALSPQQQERFSEAFRDTLMGLLSEALIELRPRRLEVQPAQMDGGGDRASVRMEVSTEDGQDFWIAFSMARTSAGWHVRNVIVDGVNLGMTYRNQFNELMNRHDGDVEAVLAQWSERVTEETRDIATQ